MLTTLIVAALAIFQMINIWKYSELFANKRATLEMGDSLISRLLRCSWCVSPWTGAIIIASLFAGTWIVAGPWVFRPFGYILMLPGYALAASKLANLLHDYTQDVDKTPKPFSADPVEPQKD